MRAYNGYSHIARDFYTSLRFGSAASVALSSLTTFASSSFSISAWVFVNSFASAQSLFTGAAGVPEIVITTSGAVTFGPNGAAVLCTSTGALNRNEWRHVTVTYNATSGVTKIYFDGEDVGASNTAGTFTAATTATVSMSEGTFLSNLVISPYVLTQGEVRAEFYGYAGAPGGSHRFKCADATGTTLADSVGTGSGTITSCTFAPYNVPTSSLFVPPSDAGYVLLDGSTGYISTTANLFHTAFNGESRLLLSSWVRLAKDAAYGYSIAITAGGTTHARLELDKTQTQGTFRSQSSDATQVSSALLANSSFHRWADDSQIWAHKAVLVNFTAGTIEHYHNGIKFARVTGATFGSPTINYSAANALVLGAAAGPALPIKGALGPVHICAGAVTDQMVRNLYLTGEVPNVNKVAYWLMEDGSGTSITQRGNVANFNGTLVGGASFGIGGLA